MKGMIICGFPGVGKTSVAGFKTCVDLESSNFSNRNGIPQKTKYWVPQYCNLAIELASEGFTVLTSTHKEVIEYFANDATYPDTVAKPVIFCPKKSMQTEWIKRLTDRYNDDPSEKNKRALKAVMNEWDEKIDFLENSGLHVDYAEENYDFHRYILYAQNMHLGLNKSNFLDVLFEMIKKGYSVTFDYVPLSVNAIRISCKQKVKDETVSVNVLVDRELIVYSRLDLDALMRINMKILDEKMEKGLKMYDSHWKTN